MQIDYSAEIRVRVVTFNLIEWNESFSDVWRSPEMEQCPLKRASCNSRVHQYGWLLLRSNHVRFQRKKGKIPKHFNCNSSWPCLWKIHFRQFIVSTRLMHSVFSYLFIWSCVVIGLMLPCNEVLIRFCAESLWYLPCYLYFKIHESMSSCLPLNRSSAIQERLTQWIAETWILIGDDVS